MNNLIGLIPAAGKGTRLAPFPCAKELFPIGYQDYEIKGRLERRPKVVSQYLFEELVIAGASKIFIILGDGKDDIMSYYGDGQRFGAQVCYLYQAELKGMPFALDLAYPWLNGETVIFGMPDTIVEPTSAFRELVDCHQATAADVTLGLFATDTPSKFSMVELDDTDRVLYNVDKPTETNLRYTWGICCWGPNFTELMHQFLREVSYTGKEVVLTQVFTEALRQNLKIQGYRFDHGQYLDIGTADELDVALRKFHL